MELYSTKDRKQLRPKIEYSRKLKHTKLTTEIWREML